MTTAHPIPDAALEADIAILGKKGRGKTYTAKGLVERVLGMSRRIVVLDPLSTWWGLKAGRHGFPVVVLGGPHGDMPLADTDGAALGRYLATASQSAVLDLGAMRKAEMIRFATTFLEELYTANRDPLWLVLEEADVFAPQNPDHNQTRLYNEVDRIARRGRQFGFRLISLTQRPARLAKDVLTQLSTLVALGITSPQDRDAIKAWVEGNADRDQAKAVVESLASLKVGEGWVWAPDLDLLERVCFPRILTPDTSATPKAGEARSVAKISRKVDVAAIRAALAKTGQDEAPIPDNGIRGAGPGKEALKAADQQGYERGLAQGERRARASAQAALFEIERAAVDLVAAIEQRKGAFGELADPDTITSAVRGTLASPVRPLERDVDPTPEIKATAQPAAGGAIAPARQRILDAIAWFESIGTAAPEREIVAFIAGASSRSSGFANNLGALRTAGLVDYPAQGVVTLTEAGRAAAVRPASLLTHGAVVAAVREKLAPAQWRLLEALIGFHPSAAARDELARIAEVSASSSGFANNLGRLRSLGLIDYPASGKVRATDILFPGGKA